MKRKKTKERISGFFADFRAFINKGNVVDMAIGVIIGGAFSKIVSSLVGDIVMPLLGLVTGQVSFTDLKLTLRAAEVAEDGTVISEAVTMAYGQFLQNVLDFLLVAFCVFLAVRTISKLRAMEERLGKEQAMQEMAVQNEELTAENAAQGEQNAYLSEALVSREQEDAQDAAALAGELGAMG
mgnify:CR=1 FL=1